MANSNVNIILGDNASGKTRYLVSKLQILSQNGVVLLDSRKGVIL